MNVTHLFLPYPTIIAPCTPRGSYHVMNGLVISDSNLGLCEFTENSQGKCLMGSLGVCKRVFKSVTSVRIAKPNSDLSVGTEQVLPMISSMYGSIYTVVLPRSIVLKKNCLGLCFRMSVRKVRSAFCYTHNVRGWPSCS